MPKRTRGRMITKDISSSEGFASLSKDAAVLFCMLIPHFNSHGKMIGDSGYVKSVVCPHVEYLNRRKIVRCLEEIDKKTHVKLVFAKKQVFIHAVNFLSDHQALDLTRLGEDLLPSYSGPSPDVCVPEVEVEVKEEVEEEGTAPETDEVYIARVKQFYNELEATDGTTYADWQKHYSDTINVDACLFAASTWLIENPKNRKKNLKRFYGNWLRNQYTRRTQPPIG